MWERHFYAKTNTLEKYFVFNDLFQNKTIFS